MPENILVIEYEPRYTEKIRTALAGKPFQTAFAHDGDEALRAFDSQKPALIILSSMVPKANTTELIHAIRQRPHLHQTPILLTVSGYKGTSPKQDAMRFGANDLLPKPYTEPDLNATRSGGTPYGASHFAGIADDLPISEDERSLCVAQGRRLAEITMKLGA